MVHRLTINSTVVDSISNQGNIFFPILLYEEYSWTYLNLTNTIILTTDFSFKRAKYRTWNAFKIKHLKSSSHVKWNQNQIKHLICMFNQLSECRLRHASPTDIRERRFDVSYYTLKEGLEVNCVTKPLCLWYVDTVDVSSILYIPEKLS